MEAMPNSEFPTMPLKPNDSVALTIERWSELVAASGAHNHSLYETFARLASAEEIHLFLCWDAEQPPFYQFLQAWEQKAFPDSVKEALRAHIHEELSENHSGLFREMMGFLRSRFPVPQPALNHEVLRLLNYTFSPECAAENTFEFFCGSFFATEIMSAKRCRQLHGGLSGNGMPDKELEYLALHMRTDLLHVEQLKNEFLRPLLESGGSAAEVERGILDRLKRSADYLGWYEKNASGR